MAKWFDPDEFDCHDGTPYPIDRWAGRFATLAGVLDIVREAWGGPLRVVSGYRTPTWNARVRGAGASQHVEGRAADIRPRPVPEEGYSDTVLRLHDLVLRLYQEDQLFDLGGLGLYPGWVHVDTRPKDGRSLATWRGAGVGSEK